MTSRRTWDMMTCQRFTWCMLLWCSRAEYVNVTAFTATLCGIWCVVMLIAASHHFHLSKFITTPPPHPSIYLPSASLSYLLQVEMQHEAAALSAWSLIAVSHHFCQSHFIISDAPLRLHPSIHLSVFICLFTEMWFEEEMELTSVWCRLQHPTVSVSHSLSCCALAFFVSHVDLARGGFDTRISFCWCNLVILIAASHLFCPVKIFYELTRQPTPLLPPAFVSLFLCDEKACSIL